MDRTCDATYQTGNHSESEGENVNPFAMAAGHNINPSAAVGKAKTNGRTSEETRIGSQK